jgi:hypothetical protein
MSTRRPWRSVAGYTALGLAGVVLLSWMASRWWLPGWIEGQIAAALRAEGVEPVTLRVSPPGLRGMQIRELRIGSVPSLRIGEIALHWSPSSLARARLEALSVRDVDWHFAVREERVDLGALEPLLRADRAEAAPASGPIAVPLDRLRVEDVRLAVETPEGAVTGSAALAFALAAQGLDSGSLTLEASDAAGALSVHARLSLAEGGALEGEVEARLSGSEPPLLGLEQGEFTLELSGRAPGAARAFAGADALARGLVLTGQLTASARGPTLAAEGRAELRLDEHTAGLRAEGVSLRAEGIAIEGATLDAELADWTRPAPQIETLRARVPRLGLDEIAVREVELAVFPPQRGEEGRFSLHGRARAGTSPEAFLQLNGDYWEGEDSYRLRAPGCVSIELTGGDLGGGWRVAEPAALCLEEGRLTIELAADGTPHFAGGARLPAAALRLEDEAGERVDALTPDLDLEIEASAVGEHVLV